MPDVAPTYDAAFKDLAEVVLEESWVLAIEHRGSAVQFLMEAVLTPRHPDYTSPRPGDVHCYCLSTLTVASDGPPRLRLSGAPPATDATGVQDLGHIDSFMPVDADGRDSWELEGDWGEVEVVEPTVSLLTGNRLGRSGDERVNGPDARA